MRNKVLLLAQGTGDRWTLRGEQFLGIPKHLVQIDGETLLDRARRLFTEAGCFVQVIGPKKDDRYGKRTTLKNPFPSGTEMDKFLGTKGLWSKRDRTIITWADCYYTEDAVDKICSHEGKELHYFRRPGASATTGHKWDESFAVSFGPKEHDRVVELANQVVKAVKSGKVKKDHIRTHYAAMLGVELDNRALLIDTPHQTVIDDWTDDFDRPDEWCRWVGRFYRHKIPVVCCMPWRHCDEWRDRDREFTHNRLEAEGIPIVYGTSDGKILNRSAARNAAVKEALEKYPETRVIFFADSDTFVPHDQLWASAYLSDITDQLVMSFEAYTKLQRPLTQSLLAGKSVTLSGKVISFHASGAMTVPVSLWHEIGGYDERFTTWGGEDRAVWLACNALRGNLDSLRVPGPAYHLWHSKPRDKDPHLQQYHDNIELAKRYKKAAGINEETGCVPAIPVSRLDPDEMREILNEPGGPLNMEPVGRVLEEEELSSLPQFAQPEQDGNIYYNEKKDKTVTAVPGSSRDMRLSKSFKWVRISN